jgi:hypothetical protein
MKRSVTDTAHVFSSSRRVLATLLALPLLGACGPDVPAGDEDCNARIRYQGVIYRPHNAVNQAAPRGGELGTGEVVGCGEGSSAPRVDEVTVHSLRSVSPPVAITVAHGEWKGIYVAEGLRRSDWPSALQ